MQSLHGLLHEKLEYVREWRVLSQVAKQIWLGRLDREDYGFCFVTHHLDDVAARLAVEDITEMRVAAIQ